MYAFISKDYDKVRAAYINSMSMNKEYRDVLCDLLPRDIVDYVIRAYTDEDNIEEEFNKRERKLWWLLGYLKWTS